MNHLQTRRLLFAAAEYDPDTSKTEANRMIVDANAEAYDSLPDEQQEAIDNACVHLEIGLQQRAEKNGGKLHMVGAATLLEILAAMSDFLPETAERSE